MQTIFIGSNCILDLTLEHIIKCIFIFQYIYTRTLKHLPSWVYYQTQYNTSFHLDTAFLPIIARHL